MKVLVCGGRDWRNYTKIIKRLSRFPKKNTIIVHGNARGADTIADRVAKSMGFEVLPYSADWDLHGDSAGPKRNTLMLDENDDIELTIAFVTPKSRGTWDMVRQSKERDIKVEVIK